MQPFKMQSYKSKRCSSTLLSNRPPKRTMETNETRMETNGEWELWRWTSLIGISIYRSRKFRRMEIREVRGVILILRRPDRSPPSINHRPGTISENAWRDLRRHAECRVLRNGGDPRKDTCRNKPRAYNSFWIARARPIRYSTRFSSVHHAP